MSYLSPPHAYTLFSNKLYGNFPGNNEYLKQLLFLIHKNLDIIIQQNIEQDKLISQKGKGTDMDAIKKDVDRVIIQQEIVRYFTQKILLGSF